MIPRRIHYCWFGSAPLPELAQRCIASWEKYCPDYEIVRWDESSFDLDCNAYVREAYDAKKWAFVTDVVRLYALVTQGGVYMDTDVEVLKPLDDILQYEAVSGFEAPTRIPTGLMAGRREQPLFEQLLRQYDDAHFLRPDGTYDLTTNVKRITDVCLKHGLVLNGEKQTVCGFTLFPQEYFCPKDSETGLIHITENTYTIHHFDGSWVSQQQRAAQALTARYRRVLPKRAAGYLAVLVADVQYNGLRAAIKNLFLWGKRKLQTRGKKNDKDKG